MTGTVVISASFGLVSKPSTAADAASILFKLFHDNGDQVGTGQVPLPATPADGASFTFSGLDTSYQYKASVEVTDTNNEPTAPPVMSEVFPVQPDKEVLVAVSIAP